MADKLMRFRNHTDSVFPKAQDRLSKRIVRLTHPSSTVKEVATEQQLLERCESLEQQLQESNKQLLALQVNLQNANEEFQQFANAVSHDLQAPLRAISGFSQFLREEYQSQLDDIASGYIDRVVGGVARMEQLIKGLITYSRVTSKAAPFDRVDLNEIVNNALASLENRICDLGAVVTADPLPTVFGDPAQLTLLFQNLVVNSLKFRSKSQCTIHIEAQKIGQYWTIAVKDNGIGIAPDRHECVFTIFRRLHAHQDYEGVGAGLAICRRITDRHSGKIWLNSEKGDGCTFNFTIPLLLKK